VRAGNGERLAFAIVSNEVPSTWRAKRVEDDIGARLARFDRPVLTLVPAAANTPNDAEPFTPSRAANDAQ
jgi:hypothetical protein